MQLPRPRLFASYIFYGRPSQLQSFRRSPSSQPYIRQQQTFPHPVSRPTTHRTQHCSAASVFTHCSSLSSLDLSCLYLAHPFYLVSLAMSAGPKDGKQGKQSTLLSTSLSYFERCGFIPREACLHPCIVLPSPFLLSWLLHATHCYTSSETRHRVCRAALEESHAVFHASHPPLPIAWMLFLYPLCKRFRAALPPFFASRCDRSASQRSLTLHCQSKLSYARATLFHYQH